MNPIKTKKFLDLITPTFNTLDKDWFDPTQKPTSACLHCSVNCGRSDKHDKDCLYQIGKEIVEKFREIDKSPDFDLSFRKEQRPEQEIMDIKNGYKLNAILDRLKPNLNMYIPIDYSDPANEGIACSCSMYSDKITEHAPDCPHPQISLALSELFK